MASSKISTRNSGAAGDVGTGNVRAVAYVRCSTDEQANRDYNTLESQRDIIARFVSAAHPEWEIVDLYEDEGFSGKDTNRPGIQALINACMLGKFDVVVVYKLDRITRSLADFYELDRLFQKYNVSFVSVKEQFDTSAAMGAR